MTRSGVRFSYTPPFQKAPQITSIFPKTLYMLKYLHDSRYVSQKEHRAVNTIWSHRVQFSSNHRTKPSTVVLWSLLKPSFPKERTNKISKKDSTRGGGYAILTRMYHGLSEKATPGAALPGVESFIETRRKERIYAFCAGCSHTCTIVVYPKIR